MLVIYLDSSYQYLLLDHIAVALLFYPMYLPKEYLLKHCVIQFAQNPLVLIFH